MTEKILIYSGFVGCILILAMIRSFPPLFIRNRYQSLLLSLISLGIMLLLVAFFCYPIFTELENLGYWDWDHHLFYHEVSRVSVLKYGQVPLWNPYYCGGHVLWQNPQVRFFTPMFLLHLALGPVLAIKIEILLHYFIALLGMYLISRKGLKINNFILSLIPALYFVFNSAVSAHIKEGHTWILCFAYMPFVFFFFREYVRTGKRKCAILSSGFLALMLYEGGIYPFPFMVLFLCFYALSNSIFKRDWAYIAGLLKVVVFAGLFSSAKALPMLAFLNEYPRLTFDAEKIPLKALYDIFLSHSQIYYHQAFPGQLYGWHDYTCYIGIILLMILLVGCGFLLSNRIPGAMIMMGIGCLFVSLLLGDMGRWSPYHMVRSLPIFRQLHVPGRYVIIIMFVVSLIVGKFIAIIDQKWYRPAAHLSNKRRLLMLLPMAIFMISFIDLTYVSRHFFYHTFRIDPRRTYDIVRKYETDKFKQIATIKDPGNPEETFNLAAVLSNTGIIECRPEALKIGVGSIPDTALITTSDQTSEISNVKFSPNRILFDLTTGGTNVFLNQNYNRGWKISEKKIVVQNIDNRVAAYLPRGEYHAVSFYYLPDSFILGGAISTLFLVYLIISAFLKNLRIRRSTNTKSAVN